MLRKYKVYYNEKEWDNIRNLFYFSVSNLPLSSNLSGSRNIQASLSINFLNPLIYCIICRRTQFHHDFHSALVPLRHPCNLKNVSGYCQSHPDIHLKNELIYIYTRISGRYAPFFLAPAVGRGPFGPPAHCSLTQQTKTVVLTP